MKLRLNHVAIAVPDLAASAAMYRDVLGADVSGQMDLAEHGVSVVFVQLPNTKIELIHPFGEKSTIAAFLEKNPNGGIHHICLETDDVTVAAAEMQKAGKRVLGRAEDRRPRPPGDFPSPEGFQRRSGRARRGQGLNAEPPVPGGDRSPGQLVLRHRTRSSLARARITTVNTAFPSPMTGFFLSA